MRGYPRILTIDGGGMRGVLPATFLTAFEARFGAPIGAQFDLVAGTSTGGIIAAALVRPEVPVSAADIAAIYRRAGPRIFGRSVWRALGTMNGVSDEKYDARFLERVLTDTFGAHRLRAVVAPALLLTAYDIERRKSVLFRSWDADLPSKDYSLADVCRATTAAPTYFEPALITAQDGASRAFIDGSVFAANPTLCALSAAMDLYPGASGYLILSLGTGQQTQPLPYAQAKNWGLAGWARPITDVILDASSEIIDSQAQEMVGDTHFRFQVDLTGHHAALDDARTETVARLEAMTQAEIARQSERVDRFLALNQWLPRYRRR
jgi:patatin-like phospholipase/acyl hydrolase